jgi:hypothetical protein
LLERLPVETLKVTLLVLTATITEAGAVSTDDALLDSVTTDPPAGAAVDNVIVQLVLLFAAKVAEVQLKPEIVTGTCREIVADAVLPPNAPVSVAV